MTCPNVFTPGILSDHVAHEPTEHVIGEPVSHRERCTCTADAEEPQAACWKLVAHTLWLFHQFEILVNALLQGILCGQRQPELSRECGADALHAVAAVFRGAAHVALPGADVP